MDTKKVLLLVGSPKKEHSTSNSIGQYMVMNFKKADYISRTIYVYNSLKSESGCKDMVNCFNESNIIILSYPLYVDSLPADCIKALKYIKEERSKADCSISQIFLSVGNCGFYEKDQLQNSLNICKFFAQENNLKWYGGIPVGGGSQLQGKDLLGLGDMTRNLRAALDIVCRSILNAADIPMDKVGKLTNLPEPRFVYSFIANLSFKNAAKNNGVFKNINDKPYILQINKG